MNDMTKKGAVPTSQTPFYADSMDAGEHAMNERPLHGGARLSGREAAARLVQTARHLKLTQAFYWALRRSWGRTYAVPTAVDVSIRGGLRMAASIAKPPSGLAGNVFDFLNVRRDFGDRIDWQSTGQSRLWLYNLHYFDYALDPSRRSAWVASTMAGWVAANPPSKSVGWEPYPASLRIVNWIKFALSRSVETPLPPACQRSLFQQVAWLERNLEHEIQANHLLKNVKALLFGGAYFAGTAADRWLRKGTRLFLDQINKQMLEDGAHFERSAMYHAIVLEDVLDVLNVAVSNRGLLPASSVAQLIRQARSALVHLDDISFPNGTISMFNDSVPGIAPEQDRLADYARAISPSLDLPEQPALRLISKPSAGLYGYRREDEMLLVDAGAPGPAHQPGHSHCGLLGFELMVGGRPLVVDSGVHDYETTPLRHHLRSTAAHNTVRIDGKEQSDIWGAFRIGRRATIGTIRLGTDFPSRFQFFGSHDGYRHLSGQVIHRRTISAEIGKWWRITDEVTGSGRHRIESFLHFHPDLRLYRTAENWIVTDEDGIARCRIATAGGACELLPSIFCAGFGSRTRNLMLRLSADAALPTSLGFTIEAI